MDEKGGIIMNDSYKTTFSYVMGRKACLRDYENWGVDHIEYKIDEMFENGIGAYELGYYEYYTEFILPVYDLFN